MSLSIIIVNYQSASLVCDCIRSAMQFASMHAVEWIVVDNDSKDNSCEIITRAFPFVKWIQMPYNAGFARANNEGIKQAGGDAILLLNPDTIILNDAVAKCYERYMQSSYMAAGVQLLNADGTPQITGNFFMKGGLNHLLPLPYLGAVLRSFAFALKMKKTHVPQAAAEQQVDWINGAFIMTKKSCIEKAGMLDEDFFLYAEEIEWCSRLRKSGALCVFGDLNIIHLQGETMGAQGKGYNNLLGKRGLQLIVSQHLRIRKQFGAGWFLFHLIMHTIEIPVFSLCSIFDNIFHRRVPFSSMAAVESYTENIMKLWKLAPAILSGKPHFYKMI